MSPNICWKWTSCRLALGKKKSISVKRVESYETNNFFRLCFAHSFDRLEAINRLRKELLNLSFYEKGKQTLKSVGNQGEFGFCDGEGEFLRSKEAILKIHSIKQIY